MDHSRGNYWRAACDYDLKRMLSSSFMVSADNAHAIHPNHPELADSANAPVMNGGVVIKFNANQRYNPPSVICHLRQNSSIDLAQNGC